MTLSTEEELLVPASQRQRQGIERRRQIRKLRAEGLTKPQMCGVLNISSQALSRHLKIIEQEDGTGSAA